MLLRNGQSGLKIGVVWGPLDAAVPPPPPLPTEVKRSTISKHVHIIFLNLISMLHISKKFSKCLLDGTKLLFIYI